MNYPNYIGSTERFGTASTSAQTFMIYDIAALQYMYGANFSHVGEAHTYTWSTTTGADSSTVSPRGRRSTITSSRRSGPPARSTYDLSNFSQNQVDDMNPGGWMLFSSRATCRSQRLCAVEAPRRNLRARQLYNALLHDADSRSLIWNLLTGSGNDSVTGNAMDNDVRSGAGNDALHGGAGNDRLYGEAGDDAIGGDLGNDLLDGGSGADNLTGGAGNDTFHYAAGYGLDTVTDFSRAEGDKIDVASVVPGLCRRPLPCPSERGRHGVRLRERRQPDLEGCRSRVPSLPATSCCRRLRRRSSSRPWDRPLLCRMATSIPCKRQVRRRGRC